MCNLVNSLIFEGVFIGFHPVSRDLVGKPAPIRGTSGGRLNSDAVIDGSAQSLLAAQIPLSGLHTNMSQQELNLFKLSTR